MRLDGERAVPALMLKRVNAPFRRRHDFNVTAPDSAHC